MCVCHAAVQNGNTAAVCNGHAEPAAGLLTFDDTGPTDCQTIDLFREFSGKGLGLAVVGGSDAPGAPTGVYIKNIFPNSIAADNGRLTIGRRTVTDRCALVQYDNDIFA